MLASALRFLRRPEILRLAGRSHILSSPGDGARARLASRTQQRLKSTA